jgi:CAAX prenyl protease-like protein
VAQNDSDRAAKDNSAAADAGDPHSSFVIRHSSISPTNPWLTFLLPFAVYMLIGALEPAAPKPPKILPDGTKRVPIADNRFGLEYRHYPIVYTFKIALTLAAVVYVLPGYRQFPFRISPLAIVVGVVGVVAWIWLCHLQLERKLLEPLGLAKFLGLGERPAFNPLAELADTPLWAHTFLAIRFVGLALVVPIIEELFLRGFLMRIVIREDWWDVPFGQLTVPAAIVGTAVPMLMHPAELLAAFVWFSMVTCLMARTRNIWDCVAAHAVTNLLLGIYVVTQGEWQLW